MKISVSKYADDLNEIFDGNPAVVFLCGPTLTDLTKPGAPLRQQLKDELEAEGFEVVLGEDDGLESLRHQFSGYAHENELKFIQGYCNAVVLIASSVGAYCELGLFAYEKVHSTDSYTDFVLIIADEFEGQSSYVNSGPAAAIEHFGKVYYTDLDAFDTRDLIQRLRHRRHVFLTSKRGRPRGATP